MIVNCLTFLSFFWLVFAEYMVEDDGYNDLLENFDNLSGHNEDVKFYLFNRKDRIGSQAYTINSSKNITAVFKNFSPEAKTKIIVHGWKGSWNCMYSKTLKNAYIPLHDYNIIVTDWSEAGAKLHPYLIAALKVPKAAEQLSIFIDRLCSEMGLRPEDLHVIGHSLGAHVAGLSGKNISSGRIGRVTGLDPAGPGFSKNIPEMRISTDSGMFVDIIHTCGGFLGAPFEIGHADFFPNAGRWVQPGCWLDVKGSCSHQRSYEYYAESIRDPQAFLSTPCFEWAIFEADECDGGFAKVTMGEYTPNWASGLYYLHTNKHPPYNKF